jgi:8-oxo-dGTP diphosphatase
MDSGTIEIVAALICDQAGRVLLVRKRGTAAFMQPGGKRDPGEDDIAALSREIAEELGCDLIPASIEPSASSTPSPRMSRAFVCMPACTGSM